MTEKDDAAEGRGFRVIDRRGEGRSEPEETSPKKSAESAPTAEAPGHPPPEDEAFAHFIMSLATSAYMHLGLVAPPGDEKPEKNLALAKQSIDILGLLAEKTKGNLSAQEEALLQQVLSELRLHFVNEQRRGAPTKK